MTWQFDKFGDFDPKFNNVAFSIHHNAALGNNGPLQKGLNTADVGWSVGIDNNNSIVIMGLSDVIVPIVPGQDGTSKRIVVWRYLDNGQLDKSFNGSGIMMLGLSIGDLAYALTIDKSTNTILATGHDIHPFCEHDMFIVRIQ